MELLNYILRKKCAWRCGHREFVIAVMLFGASAALIAGESSGARGIDPQHVRVARKLIDGLNSDSFLVREKAKDSLMKLGRASIEPLEEAAKSSESEVRLRAIELLIALRGRGLLGIQMAQGAFGTPPEWGAGVSAVQKDMPADVAGLQGGDVIVALNGEPVADNIDLQHLVFVTGPARVMDVTVERSGEKLHLPVLLTLNLNFPANPGEPPPIDLDSELPASDNPQGRAVARANSVQQFGFAGGGNIVVRGGGALVIQNGNIVIQNGNVVIQNGAVQSGQPATPTPPPAPASRTDASTIESEFEQYKATVEKDADNATSDKAAK